MAIGSDRVVWFLNYAQFSSLLSLLLTVIAIYVHYTPFQTEVDDYVVALARWVGFEALILVAELTNIFGLVGIFSGQDTRNLLLKLIQSELRLIGRLLNLHQRLTSFIGFLLLWRARLVVRGLLFVSLFQIGVIPRNQFIITRLGSVRQPSRLVLS